MGRRVEPGDVFLKSQDHPAAGRVAEPGDIGWTIDVPLENGARLWLALGRKGRDALLDMLMRENADDIAEIMEPPR